MAGRVWRSGEGLGAGVVSWWLRGGLGEGIGGLGFGLNFFGGKFLSAL